MRIHTILSCENKECSYDLMILGRLVFTAHKTEDTYLSSDNLTLKQSIKSILLQYDFLNDKVTIYFGSKNLLAKEANFQTDVLASMDFKFKQLTIKQHQQLIDFFKKAQNISADCITCYTARATGRYTVLLNQLQ